MTLRRDRKRGKKRTPDVSKFRPVSKCINCGEPGPHYVPPGFGDKGFFACETKS